MPPMEVRIVDPETGNECGPARRRASLAVQAPGQSSAKYYKDDAATLKHVDPPTAGSAVATLLAVQPTRDGFILHLRPHERDMIIRGWQQTFYATDRGSRDHRAPGGAGKAAVIGRASYRCSAKMSAGRFVVLKPGRVASPTTRLKAFLRRNASPTTRRPASVVRFGRRAPPAVTRPARVMKHKLAANSSGSPGRLNLQSGGARVDPISFGRGDGRCRVMPSERLFAPARGYGRAGGDSHTANARLFEARRGRAGPMRDMVRLAPAPRGPGSHPGEAAVTGRGSRTRAAAATADGV